ncbi:uncharacterized protein GGS22DRAFT_60341 [Annulohypoxylon maeteangense]|uniref:uncharacterized protein n=1 Tax=Annulohypoxylon maeteangense TaxID=1927788 RepID=UPI00200834ED|nr:uncharacterized protein GGS22DRAFT_60341 [Annulohypoxylon maeteangense]KAI0881636.1 hypothetical protein GGS22DRAFT_60341 [Annulohypoxylon maeteangense]
MVASTQLSDPPFSISISASSQEHDRASISPLVPGTLRTKEDHIIKLDISGNVSEFLEKELLVEGLDRAQEWLWMSGRPVPPRTLHHQLLLRRNIVVTEQPELHLVWSKDRIFIKPLPPFLLDLDFWKKHICIPQSADYPPPGLSEPDHKLAKAARGFLYSYIALITHPSDFEIAKSHMLVPKSLQWVTWKHLAQQIADNHSYKNVSPRYRYGELRLSRLNKIYRFRYCFILRGFSRVEFYSFYADFFADNFGKIAAILGYVAIVLTAMQVGLATHQLESSDTFQSVSYGFTVFSIIAPIGAAAALLIMFVCLFITNWNFARRDLHRRDRQRELWDSRYD